MAAGDQQTIDDLFARQAGMFDFITLHQSKVRHLR
jgi:hypothetical protein